MNSRRECEKYSALIEDLLEGELDEPNAGKLNSHVFACPQCLEEYEMLRREKEIYARYLFDAEPPQNLWASFQARLVSEKENNPSRAIIPAASLRRTLDIFGFLRLSPAPAAVLLVILGIVFIGSQLASVEQNPDKNLAKTVLRDSPSPPKFNEIEQQSTTDLTTKPVDKNDSAPLADEPRLKNRTVEANDKLLVKGKSSISETAKIKQKSASLREKGIPHDISKQIEAKRLAARRLKNLETEIAVQIEKTELLLRSFRNARESETVGAFDIEYERAQARRLIDENRRLRRDAENYGIVYAEELFARAEPYLLDIANLEANAAPDKILDIKERVKSQKIIASLQVYSYAATAASATQ